MSSDTTNPPLPHHTTPSANAFDSIAILSPGKRSDRLTIPLDAIDATYTVNPPTPTSHDVILCDTPDRTMFKATIKARLTDTPILFRQRGDPFWGIDEWVDSRIKQRLLYRMLKGVDGCIAMAPHQAVKYARKTQVPTDIVTLSKRTSEWPDTTHTDRELRAITLTNAVYRDKIQPLIDIAPTVNKMLDTGTWRIGSWSDGYSDYIRDELTPYENITYGLELDAHAELERANIMLHHSNLDVVPNAVLEGLSARLPVLTNPHIAFRQSPAPLIITSTSQELRRTLGRLRDPNRRQTLGDRGHQHVDTMHDPAKIGRDIITAINQLVNYDDSGDVL